MSLESAAKTLLTANSTLVTLATGGIVTNDEVGKAGITALSYPAGYHATTKKLLLVVFIRQRSKYADYRIADEATGHTSMIAALQIDFMRDGAFGFADLETAEALARSLLQFKSADGKTLRFRELMDNKRVREMDNAAIMSAVYDCYGVEP